MKNKSLIKYYVYLRKSSEGEDRQVQSIERQADEVQKLVLHSGFQIVATFQESRSAMLPNNRPEFTKMIKGIKAGKANGIICWHVNRLARNPLESGIVQQLLEDRKIASIVTKDREYLPEDNAIVYSVESSLATQYSKDLGKMIRSGMDKKVSQGIAPIRAPIGYLNTKFGEHGTNYIKKDPEYFEIVKKMWEMMLIGTYTPPGILATINQTVSLKTKLSKNNHPMLLTRGAVYQLFRNPFYTGLFEYKGKVYKGTHEPMIKLEDYGKVQILLGRYGRPRPQNHFFSYTGLITCGECGSAITATKKTKVLKEKNEVKPYIYYYCSRRKKGASGCTERKPLTEKEMEELVYQELLKVSISDDYKDLAYAILESNISELKNQEQAIRETRINESKKLKQEIKNLLQLRISDMINDEDYQIEKEQRENKLVRIEVENSKLHNNTDLLTVEKNKFEHISMLTEKFISSPPEQKKIMLNSFGWNWMLKTKKLFVSKPHWISTIENTKDAIEYEIKRSELEKYVDVKEFLRHFQSMCPLLWTVVEEVRTETLEPINEPLE
ncbi:MAG TPA: hypothetical protein DCQ50_21145 [Chryseobacterium sp.]|nr:hypothetical protein [Chryseobacterium sp.]